MAADESLRRKRNRVNTPKRGYATHTNEAKLNRNERELNVFSRPSGQPGRLVSRITAGPLARLQLQSRRDQSSFSSSPSCENAKRKQPSVLPSLSSNFSSPMKTSSCQPAAGVLSGTEQSAARGGTARLGWSDGGVDLELNLARLPPQVSGVSHVASSRRTKTSGRAPRWGTASPGSRCWSSWRR